MGLLLTLGLVGLHVEFYRHAGPLWRDEVGTVNLAGPTYADVFALRQYNSQPPAWTILLHTWMAAGLGDTDAGLRRLGLLIGVATVAAVWWSGRRLRLDAPLVTLLLLGMSPTTIVYGDTVRGYGLAMLAVTCCTGALWAFLERATWRTYATAQAAALLTVETYYGNGVLLAALCAGAAAVCLRRRAWRTLALTGVIGVIAAAAMAISLAGLSSSDAFVMVPIEQGQWSLAWYLGVLRSALAPGVPLLGALWAVAALLAAAGCVVAWWPHPSAAVASADHLGPGDWAGQGQGFMDLALYAAVAVTTAVVAYVGCAWLLTKLPTQVWHYLPLMVVIAFGCDVGIGVLAKRLRGGEGVRLAAVVVAAVLVASEVVAAVSVRMTNIDIGARKIEEAARPDDLVAVYPWTCGVTFDRYYHGRAPWITVPELAQHKHHLLVQVAEKMKLGDAGFAPELERVEQVLRNGGRVWIIGGLMAPPPGQPAPHLPPAPTGPSGWQSAPYINGWLIQLGALLHAHAEAIREIALPRVGPVNIFENAPPLLVAEGWH